MWVDGSLSNLYFVTIILHILHRNIIYKHKLSGYTIIMSAIQWEDFAYTWNTGWVLKPQKSFQLLLSNLTRGNPLHVMRDKPNPPSH